MTIEELEKLFQSKLGSRKVDFNPSSWEGMERLLNSKLPVTPWYTTLAVWIKGMTAVMVIGFSAYFIIGEPFEGYTKNGLPTEVINQELPVNSVSNSKTNTPQNSNSNSEDLESSNQFNTNNSSTNNSSSQTGNTLNSNSFAYAESDSKKKKRQRRKDKRQNTATPPAEDRFIENDQLKTKPIPTLDVEYIEQSLFTDAEAVSQKKIKKSGLSSSPLKFGFTFSTITARNLLPESEGTLNTSLKPAFAFGLVLAQPLNKNWGISTGLNYKWQKADASRFKHEVNYSFGEEHVYTTLDYKSLNSIEIPASAYYRFANRHQVNLGLYASYLWAANVEYTIETIKSFGSEKESGQRFNNTYIDDAWDYGLTAGYYYSVNSKFQMGLDSWFGLTPLQYNSDYDLKANNFQLRFTLNYWLF